MVQFENNLGEDYRKHHSHQRVSKRAIIVAISVFALIVAGMFVFALLKKAEMQKTQEAPIVQEPVAVEEVKYAAVTRITSKHFFTDGLHTLVGEIPMPTPCELLDTSVTIMKSNPEQVLLDFEVLNTSDDCIQIPASQRFKEEITA